MMTVLPALLLPLLLSQAWAAPRATQGGRSEQSDNVQNRNPFSSGPEHLKLLHRYLMEIDPLEEEAENLKRETAILHLFLLHDYDKSGRLDGLELMQLLKGILSQNSPTKPPPESVILVVDEVLEKQDLNRDGLLSAPELVTPPVYASEPLFEEDPSQDTMHLAIPPPQGTPREERQGILENITKTEKKQGEGPGSEPMDAQDISKDQTNDPAPSREEAYENSQEEPVEGDNEELTDETIPKIAGGQEEQEKEEEEKQDMQKTVGMEDEM